MILSNGSKVLVVHRRLFADDQTRYFIGTVLGYENGIAKVKGHTYIKDSLNGEFVERRDDRIKIFSIASGTLIVYELPADLLLDTVTLLVGSAGSICLTDGSEFSMDLTEITHKSSE
ncbi:MAG: hypothetical protein NPIRA02_26060 [Nitrospirales bacterium]|nr:MAG: hypothetical protein NPIRA02_26060 [Nitrospirales bacterium]